MVQIAPSGYYVHAAKARQPELRSARAKQDELLSDKIQRVWDDNMQCYGVVKVWKQLKREGIDIARCTVQRLMRQLGLQGVRRGHVIRTTIPNENAICPLGRVQRQFHADRPNQLWVSDFTYVSTWQGWFYVAFVVDVFARRIVGWRVSNSMRTDFVLDALEQALHARQPSRMDGLIHHSDSKNVLASVSMWSDSHSDRPMMDDLVVERLGWPDPHSDRPLCLSLDLSTIREHCTSR